MDIDRTPKNVPSNQYLSCLPGEIQIFCQQCGLGGIDSKGELIPSHWKKYSYNVFHILPLQEDRTLNLTDLKAYVEDELNTTKTKEFI